MCWKCGTDIDAGQPVTRSSLCPVCRSDLHSCRNCAYYEPGSHYDCHETVDELVADKERANFCGEFKLRLVFGGKAGAQAAAAKKAAALKKLDSLFSV
ncbi:MAG TPA: hypothetical protein DDW78_10165 [Treponema sp.]|nr:hypothetical protein [Treponema sp.]